MDRKLLFMTYDCFSAKTAQVQAAIAAVDKLSEERILNTDPQALIAYFVDEFRVEVPVLDIDNITAAQSERMVEVYNHWEDRTVLVPGVAFDFEMPFSGDPKIFQIRPDAFDLDPPSAEVRGNVLHFSITGRDLGEAQVKNAIQETRDSIQKYLSSHEKFWADLGTNVASEVAARIEQRRSRLEKQNGVAAGLASIGIKLKERNSSPRTYSAPTVKQKLTPKMPPMKEPTKPEPTLDTAQYDTILGLLRDAGRSIEQSSSRMRELNEEALRDMILVPLNSHFGGATGEAFNYNGKTDVLIRHEGKNLFVAECKIWRGDKHFLEAIDQLLGYLTWRDTKSVLIVFGRNTGFTSVVEKLAALPQTHQCFVSGPRKLDESSFKFIFKLPRDTERHIVLTVMGFDLGGTEMPRIRST